VKVTLMQNLITRLGCLVLGLGLVLLITANPVAAQSLWSDTASASSLFMDHKARAVGDVVTIIINETSSASRSGNASNTKSSNTEMNAGVGIFKFIGEASAGQSDSFKANGSLSNTNRVSAKITTTVTEIRPNGNMVITGTQNINQNGEEQKITVTGVIRPEDLTADNTILSSYVADAQIRIDGKGPIAGKQRQGILTQIFNFLF